MSTLTFTLLWNVGLATVLAALLGLASRSKILRRRPGLIHALWLLVLVKLITPPLIPLPVLPSLKGDRPDQRQLESFAANIVEHAPTPIERSSIVSSQPAANPPPSIPWSVILAGVSGCGTLILMTRSLAQLWRLSKILRRAASADLRLTGLARAAAGRLGMKGSPVVCAVNASITPLLWVRPSGPVIVMPTSLAERMSDEQILCIFCHELVHYVRRDHWSNAFAFLVAALFWWHPVAWWARREMRAAQEICCDGLVLATGAATRRCYAETLLQALEFVQTRRVFHPALASGFGSSLSLQRRFEMIASLNVSRRFSWWVTAILVACVAAMLCVPVRGQSDKAVDEPRLRAEDDTAAKEPQEQQSQRQVQGLYASGLNSKDYRLAEKEADHLVALLKTFGREEIYIWAYDREKGITAITASARDHQLISGLIQLLAKERRLSPQGAGSDWDNRKQNSKGESRDEFEARLKAEADALKKAQQEVEAQIKALQEELKKFPEKLRRQDDKAVKSDEIIWKRLGLVLDPIDAGQLRRIGPTLRGGLIVVAVRPKSPAAKLGLLEGDVVIGLDKWETVNLTDVQWILDRPDLRGSPTIRIWTLRDDKARQGTLQTDAE